MRRSLAVIIITLLTAFVAPTVMADHQADLYVIPVAAHLVGNNNTAFVSDVALQNFQSTPLTVTFLFIESGLENAENVDILVSNALPNGTVTIPAGGNVILKDVLDGFRGRNSGLIGSLIVSADRPFAITSRAYGTTATGTVGQSVVPVRDFEINTIEDTSNLTAVAYVPGLTSNATFRTNLGFVAGSGRAGMTIEITIKGADGNSLGVRSFMIPADRFAHVQVSSNQITPGSFDAAGAEFRIIAGDGAVTPYASVIDNRNADAIYIAGVFPDNQPFTGRSPTINIFRKLVNSMK